jgi:hypothetical protein
MFHSVPAGTFVLTYMYVHNYISLGSSLVYDSGWIWSVSISPRQCEGEDALATAGRLPALLC